MLPEAVKPIDIVLSPDLLFELIMFAISRRITLAFRKYSIGVVRAKALAKEWPGTLA
jgi:hypothetical protein